MVSPVPTHRITTPYKKKGQHWRACGWHTGVDYAAPKGTRIVAARGGVVKHTAFGRAFGDKQFEIVCPDGTSDFYGHTDTRPANGARVKTGQKIATVGSRGNSTGPHLHFERHARAGRWSCTNMRNPQTSIDHQEGSSMKETYHYGGKPKPTDTQTVGRKYRTVSKSLWNPPPGRPEFALLYLNVTKPKFRAGKTIGALRVRAMRGNNDASSYHDYLIHVDASAGGSQLITHVYFESNKAGLPTHYQVKCVGGLAEVTLSTRYRKGVTFTR
jgi:murein DD-endopeptidase MepM/ murein hydrolase activator NlpD